MHAPPSLLNIEMFKLWTRWVLRNHSGKYVIIFGKQVVPEKIAHNQKEMDRKYGACGPNPCKHIAIFQLTETSDGKDDVKLEDHRLTRYFALCVTLRDSDWEAFTQKYRDEKKFTNLVYSNSGEFRGEGVVVEAPLLSEEQRRSLEKEFDQEWDKLFPKMSL